MIIDYHGSLDTSPYCSQRWTWCSYYDQTVICPLLLWMVCFCPGISSSCILLKKKKNIISCVFYIYVFVLNQRIKSTSLSTEQTTLSASPSQTQTWGGGDGWAAGSRHVVKRRGYFYHLFNESPLWRLGLEEGEMRDVSEAAPLPTLSVMRFNVQLCAMLLVLCLVWVTFSEDVHAQYKDVSLLDIEKNKRLHIGTKWRNVE